MSIYIYRYQYIYIYIYIYVCTYIHTYIHTYVRTYVHTYIHTYIHIYIYTDTYIYIHIYIYTHTYTFVYMHIYIHTHLYIHMFMYTYIYTYYMYLTYLDHGPTTHRIISEISVAPRVTILLQSVERRPQGAIAKRKETYLTVYLSKGSLQRFESQTDDFSNVSQGDVWLLIQWWFCIVWEKYRSQGAKTSVICLCEAGLMALRYGMQTATISSQM